MTDKTTLDEAQTVFNDPPVVLVLRRKAIRMFPHGQSVAQYRNDNLNIDIAIPYTPGDLGKKVTRVATSEEMVSHPHHSIPGAVNHHFAGAEGHAEYVNRVEKTGHQIHSHGEHSFSVHPETGHVHGVYNKSTGHGIHSSHKLYSNLKSVKQKFKSSKVATSEGINEAMSAELKKIRKERGMFKRDLSRQEDRFETTKQRLDWAKRALSGHIKKHGKSLDAIGEDVVTEIALHTPAEVADYKKNPDHYKRDQHAKLLANFRKTHPVKVHTKEETTQDDDTIMEATIHSMHTIMKTQHPAKVRFRDGSSAMIDHPTAHQIMKLHSKVNRLNKKKIEGLINSGPMGIRKVSTFIKDHMK